jgi:NADH-quinone oxidoreductase subunit A
LLSVLAFKTMLFFLFILTIGFYFEWKKGALDWD